MSDLDKLKKDPKAFVEKHGEQILENAKKRQQARDEFKANRRAGKIFMTFVDAVLEDDE